MSDVSGLKFEAGWQWVGTFIKGAALGHRGISFHLRVHIVINCLPPNPNGPGPMGTGQANESAIKIACIKAFSRAGLGTTVLLATEDFSS
jgi:hypothetical protein